MHTVLVVLVAASWTVIALLVARALARRYGLSLPAWVSVPVATRAAIRLVGRLRPAPAAPPPAAPPPAAEQDWYELVGGPAMSSAGER